MMSFLILGQGLVDTLYRFLISLSSFTVLFLPFTSRSCHTWISVVDGLFTGWLVVGSISVEVHEQSEQNEASGQFEPIRYKGDNVFPFRN